VFGNPENQKKDGKENKATENDKEGAAGER
jgi:hypothetical protein